MSTKPSMKITYFKSGVKLTVTPALRLVARTVHALKQNPTVLIQKVASC